MKKKITVAISVALALFLFTYGALVIYVYHKANQDTKVKSDAIIVLGEAAMGGTSCFGPICHHRTPSAPHYNICLESRINHAVSLYKNHYASKIVMSGGTDKPDNVNEAETMKTIAIKDGIPASDILLENQSASTYQNLVFSQKVLNKAGLGSAIIVTDPSTNARAELVASKLHYKYALSPVIGSPCAHISDYIIREPIAIIYYFISGKL